MMQFFDFRSPAAMATFTRAAITTVDSMVGNFIEQRSPGCSGCQRPGDQFTGFVFLGISVGTGIVISTGLRGAISSGCRKAVGTVITVTICGLF